MKNIWFSLLTIAIITGIYSCNDFIEQDISNKTLTVLAPADGYKTSTLRQSFWWEELKGAEKYNLQIVMPGFSSIQQLILDTNITTNQFSFTLLPGTYQWRVKAVNGSGSTNYVVHSLTIDSIINLANQVLVLISPQEDFSSKESTHTFKWNKIYNADEYRFQIIKDNASDTVVDVTMTVDSITYPLSEGKYRWQVRAQNATSNSLYSSRLITIDTTAPPVSIPVSPAYGDTISNPVVLTWNRDASAIADSIFIYSDSLVTSPVYSGYTLSATYSFTGTTGMQDYFWRVKSSDAAGNWSGYSALMKFWIP